MEFINKMEHLLINVKLHKLVAFAIILLQIKNLIVPIILHVFNLIQLMKFKIIQQHIVKLELAKIKNYLKLIMKYE